MPNPFIIFTAVITITITFTIAIAIANSVIGTDGSHHLREGINGRGKGDDGDKYDILVNMTDGSHHLKVVQRVMLITRV